MYGDRGKSPTFNFGNFLLKNYPTDFHFVKFDKKVYIVRTNC